MFTAKNKVGENHAMEYGKLMVACKMEKLSLDRNQLTALVFLLIELKIIISDVRVTY